MINCRMDRGGKSAIKLFMSNVDPKYIIAWVMNDDI